MTPEARKKKFTLADRALIKGNPLIASLLCAFGSKTTGKHFAYAFQREQAVDIQEVLSHDEPLIALQNIFVYTNFIGKKHFCKTVFCAFKSWQDCKSLCSALESLALSHREWLHYLYFCFQQLGASEVENRTAERFLKDIGSIEPFDDRLEWFLEARVLTFYDLHETEFGLDRMKPVRRKFEVNSITELVQCLSHEIGTK